MKVKITSSDGTYSIVRTNKKTGNQKEIVYHIISEQVFFTRPGRIEWITNPLTGDLVLALVEDYDGITTIEVVES